MNISAYSCKRLTKIDDICSFDCGSNEWEKDVSGFLREDAYDQQEMGLNVTWLFYNRDDLVGYTSLVSSDLKLEKEKKSTPLWKSILGLGEIERENVPCILVAQFGVNSDYKKQGVGSYMLSWVRGAALKSQFGARLLTLQVDRKNKMGRKFWKSKDFINFDPAGGNKQLFMVYNLYGE